MNHQYPSPTTFYFALDSFQRHYDWISSRSCVQNIIVPSMLQVLEFLIKVVFWGRAIFATSECEPSTPGSDFSPSLETQLKMSFSSRFFLPTVWTWCSKSRFSRKIRHRRAGDGNARSRELRLDSSTPQPIPLFHASRAVFRHPATLSAPSRLFQRRSYCCQEQISRFLLSAIRIPNDYATGRFQTLIFSRNPHFVSCNLAGIASCILLLYFLLLCSRNSAGSPSLHRISFSAPLSSTHKKS